MEIIGLVVLIIFLYWREEQSTIDTDVDKHV